MAKEEKNVSIRSFDSVLEKQAVPDQKINWNGVEVTVKHTIGLTDVIGFVNGAVEMCYMEDGTYVPEVLDFAVRVNILTRYANFRMPSNLEHAYRLAYETDAVDAVCDYINEKQMKEIIDAINRSLNYRNEAGIAEIRKRAKEMLDAIEKTQKEMADLFSDVSSEDIGRLIGAVVTGKPMDEEKIVHAFLNEKESGGDDADGEDKH